MVDTIKSCRKSNLNKKLNKKINKLTALDLFCGAGGFSCGFEQAGFEIIGGIDNNDEALRTYEKNFGKNKAINIDLANEIIFSELKKIFTKKIDVIIGGPPCQGFSVAGKRLADDPRNKLYKAYLSFIDFYAPRAVIIENVPSILNLYEGRIAKEIIRDLSDKGYQISIHKINAAEYGIPQSRKRVFFIGIKEPKILDFELEKIIDGSFITSEMAIGDLPLLDNDDGAEIMNYTQPAQNNYQKRMRNGSKKIYNHSAVIHKPETKKIISLVPDGGNYKDLPKKLQSTRKVNIAWTRLNSKKPSFTIDAGHNHHFHYKANRVPTVRESARIQSFPDSFVFVGGRVSQYRQVGNAVPPLLAKLIGEKIAEILN